jgi:AraC-like DNA-binding protein
MIWSYLIFSGVTSGFFICAIALWRDHLRHRHFIAAVFGLTLVQLMKTFGLHLQGDRELYYAWLFPQNAATVLIAAGLVAGTMAPGVKPQLARMLYIPSILFVLAWPVWFTNPEWRTQQNWVILQTLTNGLLVTAAALTFFRLRWLANSRLQKPHTLLVARWLYAVTLMLAVTALAAYLLTRTGIVNAEKLSPVPVRFVIQSLLLHIILAIMFMKPNLLQLVGFAHKARYENSHLTQIDTADLAHSLIDLLKNEKPYHEPDFTKHRLAEMLDVTPHQLGELLNVHIGKSFSELTNALRCADLGEAIAGKPQLTLLELGLALGFNSKSAINLNFKRMTTFTPSEFAGLANRRQHQIIQRLRGSLQTRESDT